MTLRGRWTLAQTPALFVVAAVTLSGGMAWDAAALVVVGCLLSVVMGSYMVARAFRPVSVLSQAARRLRQGDMQARVQLGDKDELHGLMRDFNAIAQRLADLHDSAVGQHIETQHVAQAVVNSLDNPVLVLRLSGSVLLCNEAAAALVSLREDGTHETLYEAPQPLSAALDAALSHVQQKGQPYAPDKLSEAVTVVSPRGPRAYLCHATPLRTSADSLSGVTLALQDVTRIVRLDELKNDLVATAAHELRTPLTSLQMSIHICLEQSVGPLNGKQAELLYAARDDCQRLTGIVDELLDLSRMQAGRVTLAWELLDAAGLARTVLDTHRALAAQHGVTLRSEVLPASYAWMDGERIQMVLRNLLVNAIRYSEPQSDVVIAARSADDAWLRLEVIDHGAGVPTEHQEAIFEKYAQIPGSPRGAAGLGLFIARQTVEAHGGRMGVRSEPGQGSLFWFTLPKVQPQD